MSETEVHKILDGVRAVKADKIIVIYTSNGVTRYAHAGHSRKELVTARNFLNNRLGRTPKPPMVAPPARDERSAQFIEKAKKVQEVKPVVAHVRKQIIRGKFKARKKR
jgi:hypothetical protein